jgi:hypothetical protein
VLSAPTGHITLPLQTPTRLTSQAAFGPLRVTWDAPSLTTPLRKLFGSRDDIDDSWASIEVRCTNVDRPESQPDAPEVFSLGVPKAYALDDGFMIHDGSSTAWIASDGGRIELRLFGDALAEREVFRVHALPGALAVAARRQGYFHMHAAVMRLDGAGIVVSGDGHAGKSTVASSLLSIGADWGTDDIALFSEDESGTRIWGVPRAFHIRPRTAEMFPVLRDTGSHAIGFNNEERWEVDLSTQLPDRQVTIGVHPRLVLFPRIVTDGRTAVTEIDGAEAVTRLMTTSALVVVESLGRQEEQLAALSTMASAAATYEITLGPDALDDPRLPGRTIRSLL